MKDIIEVDVNAFNLNHFKLAMYETLKEFCESKANILLIAMYYFKRIFQKVISMDAKFRVHCIRVENHC